MLLGCCKGVLERVVPRHLSLSNDIMVLLIPIADFIFIHALCY